MVDVKITHSPGAVHLWTEGWADVDPAEARRLAGVLNNAATAAELDASIEASRDGAR